MAFDPLTIVMVVILAALVFFMFRNSRKRRRDQDETRSKMVPGAEVMTNFGLYGTLLSVDESDNTALIETSPGTRRQGAPPDARPRRRADRRRARPRPTATSSPDLPSS